MQLILDRSSAATLIAFGERTLTLPGRDETWVAKLGDLLGGEKPTALTVGVGPGSFAGIRAAIACLQGLGLGWGLKPRGFPSAAALALASDLSEVTVVGDARRGTLWAVRYRRTGERLEQIGDFRILARERFVPTSEMVSPDAARLAEFALRPVELTAELLPRTVAALGEAALLADPLPIYLHPAVGAAHAE
ncbi:MAG: hypothetical protein MSB12_02130 [Lentisphaeraceae bacterium]|nr:hypothetical protein [Lentisphaeraceae bacterium]